MTVLPPVDPRDYEVLDRYLRTAFQLLEGFAEVEEARETLRDYLEFHHQQRLPPELAQLLIDLFFLKCRRRFTE